MQLVKHLAIHSDRMGKGLIKKKICLLIIAALELTTALTLSGCKGMELENKTEMVEEYTEPQAMILIANERNRYEAIYSDKIWAVKVGDEESGFDKLTVQNVKDFMEELELLNLLAADRGISVNSSERDLIRRITDEYMNGLTEADLAYMGCSREDVQTLYTDYYIAEKLINSITSNVDTEISDSEVKVIRIAMIGTSDLKKAKAILKRIKIDGESFSAMASRYNELDENEMTLMRSEKPDLIEKTAFSLEEGHTSNILAVGDMYYIINCVDGYDDQATSERKDRLSKAINTKAVREILEPYRREHLIQFMNKFWNEIDFSEPSGSTADNFFDVYNKMAG